MFSIMNFFPTFAHLVGGKVANDRPIDGVDQTDLLLGRSDTAGQSSNFRWPEARGVTLETVASVFP
jgi:hypothetical protein